MPAYHLDLDWVVNSYPDKANTIVEANQWLADGNIPDVEVTILAESGPGGGWPLVRFASDNKSSMDAIANKYWENDPDMATQAKADME
jgi:hypothetical protein